MTREDTLFTLFLCVDRFSPSTFKILVLFEGRVRRKRGRGQNEFNLLVGFKKRDYRKNSILHV